MHTLIVDANNICHIVWRAFGDAELSYEDELTGVLWGFFNQIGKLAERFETHQFVFCWDSRQRKRKLIYPDYKTNRESIGEISKDTKAVFDQFDKLRKELLPKFGFKNILWSVGLEADDLIAVVVMDENHWKHDPVIVSTDKDMWQLLNFCPIYRPVNKETLTMGEFQKRFPGIEPKDWVQMRAMIGDPTDNIPGIQGVGEKIAHRYITGQLKPGTQVYKRLVSSEGLETIYRNTQLMKLPYPGTDRVLLDFDETFRTDDFIAICDRYGFQSFLKQDAFRKWRERFNMED